MLAKVEKEWKSAHNGTCTKWNEEPNQVFGETKTMVLWSTEEDIMMNNRWSKNLKICKSDFSNTLSKICFNILKKLYTTYYAYYSLWIQENSAKNLACRAQSSHCSSFGSCLQGSIPINFKGNIYLFNSLACRQGVHSNSLL